MMVRNDSSVQLALHRLVTNEPTETCFCCGQQQQQGVLDVLDTSDADTAASVGTSSMPNAPFAAATRNWNTLCCIYPSEKHGSSDETVMATY